MQETNKTMISPFMKKRIGTAIRTTLAVIVTIIMGMTITTMIMRRRRA